ncbi:MAG: hypothetical protein ACFFE4_01670 [Candidatus Thorarchaeota archaeon]
MSSKSFDQKEYRFDYSVQDPKFLKSVVIPYSIFYKKTQKFIYSGYETIPFKMRDPSYRKILIAEFSNEESTDKPIHKDQNLM